MWKTKDMENMKNFTLEHDDVRGIGNLLVGRKIVSAALGTGILFLDNGTVLEVKANNGCGGCVSGWYSLEGLEKFDNVITNVTLDESEQKGPEGYRETVYEIFVYTDGVENGTSVVKVSGDDGNGYYGTGYKILVSVGA